jgi:hypothetical protein
MTCPENYPKMSVLSVDCILTRHFISPELPISTPTAFTTASHSVDQAAALYLSSKPKEALSVLLAFREEIARDPLAAGVDRQLQAMLGSISAYLVLHEFTAAENLILKTSEVVESILVGRDRRKHYFVSIALLSYALLLFYSAESVDRKFSNWLISESNLILARRSAPHLLPLLCPVFLFSDDSIVSLRKRFPSFHEHPLAKFVKSVLVDFREDAVFPDAACRDVLVATKAAEIKNQAQIKILAIKNAVSI